MQIGRIAMLLVASLALPTLALAEGEDTDRSLPRLGLDPGEPQVRSAAPSLPFGVRPAESGTNVLDFHGYLLLPMRVGVHKRDTPAPGQSGTVLHSPPLIPQDLRSFQYTGVIPAPWAQLNFTYGNSTVSATTIVAATSFFDAGGYFDPVQQLGIYDAFLTADLSKPFGIPFQVNVGAMSGRYGAMGEYDAGRYATPLIARTNTIGEDLSTGIKAGDVTFVLEQGFGGQLGKPPTGMVPAGWNDFANTGVGASFVNQLHAGASFGTVGRIGLHYLTAWSQDDTVAGGLIPDGRITVLGADAHLTAGRGGHLFVGAARTQATNAAPVSGVIEILNARGGPELISEYLGPNSDGTGSLTTLGGQYDLSLARAFAGSLYKGQSPDVLLSLFGVMTSVKSNDPDVTGTKKLKAGAELTYSMMSWLGLSARGDYVKPSSKESKSAFMIVSPRLLFHTGWMSRDELALQYSYFSYGSQVNVKTGFPPAYDPSVSPDKHVVSLTGTFWW
jgi:hypothetical protein